jgi:hypothetical protein
MKLLLPLLTIAACTGNGVETDPRILGQASGCALPQGALQSPNITGTPDQLVGTWVRCSGPGLLGIDHEAGIELDADFSFTVLVGSDGNLVAQTGFGNQGSWDYGEGQFDWHITPNEGQGGSPALETDPRRFALYVDYNEEMSVYAIQDQAAN